MDQRPLELATSILEILGESKLASPQQQQSVGQRLSSPTARQLCGPGRAINRELECPGASRFDLSHGGRIPLFAPAAAATAAG
jgi:hypothetical protein